MLNNITFQIGSDGKSSQIPKEFVQRIYSGTRNNVFRVDFLDTEYKSIDQQIKAIKSVTDANIPQPIEKIEDLTKFIVSFANLPDRVSPESGGEYRVPFFSHKFQSNRQSFDTFTITFIEPIGMLIKAIFKYYIFAYVINPWYNVIQEQKNYKFIVRVTHYSHVIFKDNDKLVTLNDKPQIPARIFTFYGVFPTSVNSVTLSYDSTEQINTEVTFSYDYFDVKDELVTSDTVWNTEPNFP